MNKDIIKAGGIIELKEGHNIILGKKYNKGEQMSDKYIIKNCPALYQIQGMTNECLASDYQCKDCTDCVMKQIYEMCKSQKESSCIFAVAFLADGILKLLDIEECE